MSSDQPDYGDPTNAYRIYTQLTIANMNGSKIIENTFGNDLLIDVLSISGKAVSDGDAGYAQIYITIKNSPTGASLGKIALRGCYKEVAAGQTVVLADTIRRIILPSTYCFVAESDGDNCTVTIDHMMAYGHTPYPP